MLKLLDIFFLIFHTILIFFNLFAWIFRKTRKLNFIILALTGASWFILGIFYGIGYCPLTDWHFNILKKMGHTNLPDSYIKYITDRLTGLNLNPELVNNITLISFFTALVISTCLNIRDYRIKMRQ
ncbi:MAG: DUF2784 family protein [Bacteroidales bacterium]|nr:MAG: DUF2784 family protein [Bacteroidales bacterium]